jgi:hypothetical protein
MFHSSATGRRREQTLPDALGLRQALMDEMTLREVPGAIRRRATLTPSPVDPPLGRKSGSSLRRQPQITPWSISSRGLCQPRAEAAGKLVTESNLSLCVPAQVPAVLAAIPALRGV